jgi:hypothetical protein
MTRPSTAIGYAAFRTAGTTDRRSPSNRRSSPAHRGRGEAAEAPARITQSLPPSDDLRLNSEIQLGYDRTPYGPAPLTSRRRGATKITIPGTGSISRFSGGSKIYHEGEVLGCSPCRLDPVVPARTTTLRRAVSASHRRARRKRFRCRQTAVARTAGPAAAATVCTAAVGAEIVRLPPTRDLRVPPQLSRPKLTDARGEDGGTCHQSFFALILARGSAGDHTKRDLPGSARWSRVPIQLSLGSGDNLIK